MTSPGTSSRAAGWSIPIPFDAGLDSQFGLQRGNGVARLAFFPEADHGVGHQQNEDDPKIRPVPDHGRKDHRHLDHPWVSGPQK
jgi:hypothetical protein